MWSKVPFYVWALLLLLVQACGAGILGTRWTHALRQTMFEQGIEDTNSLHKIDNHIVRRLIVMPLKDVFKPNQADIMHGKIQYGDKCSLPSSIGRLMFEKRYEVPWIFEMKAVRGLSSSMAADKVTESVDAREASSGSLASAGQCNPAAAGYGNGATLNKVYCSPLDFRSPENYIFLPRWMMHDMGLAPNDVVDVSLVRIKLAGLVVFQPLSLDWDELMQTGTDPKTLLEQELNKYSSLTSGSTIYIEVQGKEYPLLVKKTVAEDGIEVRAVRVQDSDVNTDIDRSVLDKLQKERRDQQQRPVAP